MARPIAPTPKLNVAESEAFLRKVSEDLKKPLAFVPTPKLKEALRLIRKNATQR